MNQGKGAATTPGRRWLRHALERFGSRHGWHRTWPPRLLPWLLAFSAAVWVFAPGAWRVAMTPWVGSLALLAAGIYLARVVLAVGRTTGTVLEGRGAARGDAAARLERTVIQALIMAALTLLLGVAFLFVSRALLAPGAAVEYAGLLWALCLGGLLLSLFIGEVILMLVDAVDAPAEEPGRDAD